MPNSTDFTVFKQRAFPGLNFAFVDGYENYHRPTDTPENLDPRSLQHHGSYALALMRHFGNLDLTLGRSEPDAIYFHAMGPHLIAYPGRLARPLMIAAVVLYGLVVLIGLRRGRLTERGIELGAALGFLAVGLATAAAWGAWSLLARNRPMTEKGPGSPEVALGLMALGLVVALGVYLIPRGRMGRDDLAMGGLFWWLALTVGVTLRLPAGSYLFVWPTLFGLAGVAAPDAGEDARRPDGAGRALRRVDPGAGAPAADAPEPGGGAGAEPALRRGPGRRARGLGARPDAGEDLATDRPGAPAGRS